MGWGTQQGKYKSVCMAPGSYRETEVLQFGITCCLCICVGGEGEACDGMPSTVF